MKVNILGVPYTIQYKSPAEDKFLRECDGYCDKSSHTIVVNTENGDLEDIRNSVCGMRLSMRLCSSPAWAQIGNINPSDMRRQLSTG